MKRYLIIMTAVAGCLSGCAASRLSRDIVGQWQVTHFDAYGTPMPNVVLIADFKPDGTWQSEARADSGTNTFSGTYSVSGNELTLHSVKDQQPGDWNRYTYSNGILVSIAPTRRNIAIKMETQNNPSHHTTESRARARLPAAGER